MRRTAATFTALVLAVVFAGPGLAAPTLGAVTLFADVPTPGHPDTSIIAPDGSVLVSTNRGAMGSTGPSKVFRYSPTGTLIKTYTISGQHLASNHGVMGMAFDKAGRLYVADYSPPRILRITLGTSKQETFATVPDLAGCFAGGFSCDNGIGNQKPWPDGLAFTKQGNLLITDLAQGTIFSVGPTGGVAQPWLQDPLFTSAFGPNQVVFDKDGSLVVDVTASLSPASTASGAVYRVPISRTGQPGALTKIFSTLPGEGPDGFTIGTSGRIYLCTLVTNRVIAINPDGSQAAAYTSSGPNAFDSPSSALFQGSDLLITNLTYFTSNHAHDKVLRLHINDTGLQPYPLR